MKSLKYIWYYIVMEPVTWIFYCFFQPMRFKREFEIPGYFKWKRVLPMIRLAMPLFFCFYLGAVIRHLIWMVTYRYNIYPILIEDAKALLISIIVHCIVGGFILGIARGIVFSMVCGASLIWLPYPFTLTLPSAAFFYLPLFGSFFFGITLIDVIESNLIQPFAVSIFWMAAAFIMLPIGLIFGWVSWDRFDFFIQVIQPFITLCVVSCFLWMISSKWLPSRIGNLSTKTQFIKNLDTIIYNVLTNSIVIWIVLWTTSIAFVALWSLGSFQFSYSFNSKHLRGIGLVWDLLQGWLGLVLALALIIGGIYCLGASRILLYPFSCFSSIKMYLNARKNPTRVFHYLHHSSLYWDEAVFIPLLGLKQTLLIALQQDREKTQEEITFIRDERKQQDSAVKGLSRQFAFYILEESTDIYAIAQAYRKLAVFFPQITTQITTSKGSKFLRPLHEILPQEAVFIDFASAKPFVHFFDASQEANRYLSPVSQIVRQKALENMGTHLHKILAKKQFREAKEDERVKEIARTWLTIVQQAQEKFSKALREIGYIFNPYSPGQALKIQDTLFVGRHDIVQQLEKSLSTEHRRPTFLLNGERRMGKSSTLRQLPNLLGVHYLPIFYDLQMRGISSSAATFLGTIAKEIHATMKFKGMQAEPLGYGPLQKASQRNEAAAYQLFEEWFADIEQTLEQEDRTLLLTFDEFEKLKAAEEAEYLDLSLLLDWFRSVIQNHSRLALLFSGIHTFNEMGPDWVGYFVNVQTLRVSFLRPAEARQLIAQSNISNASEQEIFGEEIVEELLRMTACHPFLIQALCSALIDYLNEEERGQAVLSDVPIAVEHVLEHWDGYFQDLWLRSDLDQRACLTALHESDRCDLLHIERCSGLNERTAQRVMQTLLKRDLVLLENNSYRIASPMFSMWMKQNS